MDGPSDSYARVKVLLSFRGGGFYLLNGLSKTGWSVNDVSGRWKGTMKTEGQRSNEEEDKQSARGCLKRTWNKTIVVVPKDIGVFTR